MSPEITVGVPVYNGRRYLGAAIEAILSQTFAGFELLIADNDSSDGSLEIAREWEARDSRITVMPSATNLGAAPNFNRLFAAARGKYFKWAACDDLIEPAFLQVCHEALEQDPAAVLTYTDTLDIDAEGGVLGPIYDSKLEMRVSCPDPVPRFRDLILCDHSCTSIFGLIRRDALRNSGLIGSYAGSDRVLLAQLALRGPFIRVREPLMLHREHPDRSTRAIPHLRDRAAWFDSSLSKARTFPHWRILREYAATVLRARLAIRQKALCFVSILRSIRWGSWRGLVRDLRGRE